MSTTSQRAIKENLAVRKAQQFAREECRGKWKYYLIWMDAILDVWLEELRTETVCGFGAGLMMVDWDEVDKLMK